MHVSAKSSWCGRLLVLVLFVLTASAADALARQAPQPPVSSLKGTVTTQGGSIPLGGVALSLRTDRDHEISALASEGDGTFTFAALTAGKYVLIATAQGFETLTVPITIVAGETTTRALDLKIAAVAETVDVVASSSIVANTGTLTSSEGLTSRELEEITSVGGLQSALKLLVSVIEVPGGVSIKGGRPNQATVQLGPGAFVDPATGLSQVTLPDDAIDSVTVLPNPYAVEYGRFSSGLVLIQTRRATDVWKTRINKLEPSFRTERGEPLHIVGISSFTPRLETGGPLIKNRLFLQQAAQFRYRTNEVPSRPQSELKKSYRFSSFTRVDANLSAKHVLVAAAGFFPTTTKLATLGTFTPPDASVNTSGGVNTASITERSLWSDRLFSETTVEVHGYDTTVTPRGPLPMALLPETTIGNFYNTQRRSTQTYQVIETVSGSSQGPFGLHLFKGGLDVLHSRYEGDSASKPVDIRRTNNTLSRRLDYQGAPMAQGFNSTDLALFAQDRVQPTSRWYVEFGARLDRDGVIGRFNVTPRVGSAVLLNAAGTSVIRSGYGLFFERTPSAAGVFESYQNPLETRYADDGFTLLGPAVLFRHVAASDLRTSRSLTWDAAFDHRFNQHWALHVGAIDRRGSRELLVVPVQTPSGAEYRLESSGRSAYREAEVGLHYTGGPGIDLNASYVRSTAQADQNAFSQYFDHVLSPIIGANAYATAKTEVPHRLLLRGRASPIRDWLVVGVLDWRSGLPYSVVDAALDFVGPRNVLRFPTYVRLDLGLEHRVTLGKYRPWIGVRVDNALNAFLPADVQANISSPAFGNFYNSEFRQFRIQVRFER